MTSVAWSKLLQARELVHGWPLYVESTKGMTMSQVVQRMRRLKREKGVRVFLVDHIGRISLKDHDDERNDLAIGAAANDFLEEAERLGACPVAFHQLSKRAEEVGATPSLGWLFNSDVLAHHARVVGFLTREGLSFDVYLKKATYGPSDVTVQLGWNPESMRVFNPKTGP